MPSIYKREPREDGYTFVTCPDFPGFSYMLKPGEDDTSMNAVFVQFLALDIEAAKASMSAVPGRASHYS